MVLSRSLPLALSLARSPHFLFSSLFGRRVCFRSLRLVSTLYVCSLCMRSVYALCACASCILPFSVTFPRNASIKVGKVEEVAAIGEKRLLPPFTHHSLFLFPISILSLIVLSYLSDTHLIALSSHGGYRYRSACSLLWFDARNSRSRNACLSL